MTSNLDFKLATSCRLCGCKHISVLMPLEPMPPGDLYKKTKALSSIPVTPADVQFCSECGHIQFSCAVSPDVLYHNYLSRPASTNTNLSDIYEAYADEIRDYAGRGRVVEIGSNDGLFLEALKKRGVDAVGIEPARNLHDFAVTNRQVKSVNEYFSEHLLVEYDLLDCDVIFANHSLSNIEDINGFACGVAKGLKSGGVFIVQTFYQLEVFNKLLIENYNHEHLSYFTVRSLRKLFGNHGLTLFKACHVAAKGGSVRCYFRKDGTESEFDGETSFLLVGEDSYERLCSDGAAKTLDYIKETSMKFSTLVAEMPNGKKIAAYGTSIGATVFTYQFGIASKIAAFFDDDPLRQGLFSPGFGVQVLSGGLLSAAEYPICIIMAPLYSDQIIHKNKEYLDAGGRFVKFWPKYEVISR
jgi:SAM-dependent methyltransferase